MNGQLLEAHEVAELLSAPVRWMRAEVRAGRISGLELGRHRRYDRDAVLARLATQRAGQWPKHRPRVAS